MSQRSPTEHEEPWKLAALLAAWLLYLVGFYAAVPSRGQSLLLVFFPDEVWGSWVAGDFGHIGLWDRVPLLLMAGVLVGTAFFLGRWSLAFLRCGPIWSRVEVAVFSLGIGLSELSLLMLVAGLCGGLHHGRLAWVLVVGVWVGGLGDWWRKQGRWGTGSYLGQWRRQPEGPSLDQDNHPRSDPDWLDRYGLWLGAPFVVLILLGAMLPPVDFDVREYHLQVPKEWFQNGRIDFLPHNVYGNMPLGAEMHALFAMVLLPGDRAWWWGALVGKTVMAAFAPLTALALFAAGRRFVSPTAGVVAALVYLSTPWIAHVSVNGLNDGAVAFYLCLAFYAWGIGASTAGAADGRDVEQVSNRPSAGGSRRNLETGLAFAGWWPWLAGFLAGSAAACKYPGFLFVVAPLGAAVLWPRRAWHWKPAACFALAVCCACGPWLAKNSFLAGNPVYPLVFGGHTRTAEKMEQWNRAHRVPPDAHGQRYTLAQAAESLAQLGWRSPGLSPLLVPLAALAVVPRRHRRVAAALAGLLSCLVLLWWLGTHRIDRFLVPALPVAALLAGLGATWSASHAWRTVLAGLLLAGLAANLLYDMSASEQDHRYLVALERLRRDEPREPDGMSRVNPAHRYLNEVVPHGHRVLLVGDAQAFDLEVPVLYNTCFDDCLFEQLLKGRSREERIVALRAQRISHIYVNWSEIRRYRSPGNYGFTDYVTPALVHDELVRAQGILRRVDLPIDPAYGEVFEVRPGDRAGSPAQSALRAED